MRLDYQATLLAVPSVELIISAFLGVMLIASLVASRLRLPYTVVLVLAGMLIATLSLSSTIGISVIYNRLVQGGLFVGLVVPPLLFESMINVRTTDVRYVVRPAFILATIGVVISTLVGGLLLWRIADFPPFVSFLFSAIIAPTDVVTVLEIFRRLKVPSRLATLMEMEAAFNDATAIIIFSLILTSFGFSGANLFSDIATFTLKFGGGIVIGLAVAFAMRFIATHIADRFSNTILTVSAVYGSYALAVALGTSGLISVAIVGLYYGSVTLQKYTRPSSRESVRTFWQFAAFLGNSVAFLFVGLSTNLFQVINGLGYIAVAYISVLISRIASVLPVMYFFDPRRKAIPAKWNAVMVLGGMRGAVSIALAASVPIGTLDSNIISTMVLGVAFISITLQGLFLARYISRNFPEEQRSGIEERRLQLYRTIASLETLQAAHERALISDEEFTVQLEEERDKLFEIIEDTGNDDRLDEKLKSDFRKLHAQLLQNKNKDNRPEVNNVESLRKSAEEAIIILTSSTIKS